MQNVAGAVNGSSGNTSESTLLPQHLADLRRSGLSDQTIAACGFRSVEGAEVTRILCWKKGGEKLKACLTIPFIGLDGKRLDYLRLKPDCPLKDKKGRARKYESPKGAANRAYFPPLALDAVKDASRAIVIVEGEKKAAKAAQEGFPAVGLVGTYGWCIKRQKGKSGKSVGKWELLPDLAALPWKGRTVIIVFDSDAVTNNNVRWAEWHLAATLKRHGALVKIVRLPPGPPGEDSKPAKVGLDDFLMVQGADALRKLVEEAATPEKPSGSCVGEDGEDREHTSPRPAILITHEEYRVNEAASAALTTDPTIFQRSGLLVRMVDTADEVKGICRAETPRIDALPTSLLRDRLTAVAEWVEMRETKDGTAEVSAHPPGWCVAAVHARAHWPGVRHLHAVVNHPVLRPDGTVLSTPGYDPDTGLLLHLDGPAPEIPENPSQDDAAAALKVLLDVVCDFPLRATPTSPPTYPAS